VSVLLADAGEEQTLTITHVLWAMSGVLPTGQEQRPHRHQPAALDLIQEARPGCYTLLGTRPDERGHIVNPVRVDWKACGAFVTPPACGTPTSTSPAHPLTSSRSRTRGCKPNPPGRTRTRVLPVRRHAGAPGVRLSPGKRRG